MTTEELEAGNSTASSCHSSLQVLAQLGQMDAHLLSRVFRQLFSHQTCSRLCYPRHASAYNYRRAFSYSRSYAKPKPGKEPFNQDSNWQQRLDYFPADRSREFEKYPLVTADSLRTWKKRPRKVKMLTRDFVEGKAMTSFGCRY